MVGGAAGGCLAVEVEVYLDGLDKMESGTAFRFGDSEGVVNTLV